MSLHVIGIDPGLSGALAIVGPKGLVAVQDMPVMQRAMAAGLVKNQVNAAAVTKLLKEWISGYDKVEILVVLEHQAPFRIPGSKPQGSSSVFSLGHTAGILEGVVVALGLPHREVTPVTWKKALGLPGGAKNKGVVRSRTQRLYPEAPLTRVMDHNRAEAIMIARYGYEEFA
jgi:crossover junction endodeoxyribonuclease RuvC